MREDRAHQLHSRVGEVPAARVRISRRPLILGRDVGRVEPGKGVEQVQRPVGKEPVDLRRERAAVDAELRDGAGNAPPLDLFL